MIRTAIFTLALAATLLAGCGSDERDQAAAAAGPAPKTDTDDTASKARSSAPTKTSAARRGTTIKAVNSQFEKILADGRGQAVYIFDKETSSRPKCYGACAKAWPPVLTNGRPWPARAPAPQGSTRPAGETAGGR